jgi:glycosyltransferase involved in cell wall biosynthesis
VKILVIGKFPPVEGGVSGHTFWLARALAGQGHSVHVVTNAGEVEATFAQLHYGDDPRWWQERVGSGHLRVHQTEPVAPGSFIPFAQPHVTKLFGLSCSVVEEHGCDVILSWYFEPYGFVAALVGQATGRPCIIRHAGSDLGRLADHPELKAAYRWALGAAAGLVVTNEPELRERIGRIDRPRIKVARSRLPGVFHSSSDPLDVAGLLEAAEPWFARAGLPDSLARDVLRLNAKPLPPDVFTLGIYGKVGVTKGSFDLVEALSSRAPSDSFAFLTMSCGYPEVLQRYYEALLASPALAARSWILPPVGPWRVPSFLRRCNAVCFLERDFPIPFHGPLIPREVLASGAGLVCSAQVAAHPFYRGNLVDDRNAVIIADPRDHAALASRLGLLMGNRDLTWAIGRQGQLLARFWDEELDDFDVASSIFAAQIQRLIHRRARPAARTGSSSITPLALGRGRRTGTTR